MLRDPNLVSLSHQHQHALALCVSIGKAFSEVQHTPDVHIWEQEIVALFDSEMARHFEAEERFVFPIASQHEQLQQLVDELRIEHTLVRRNAARARARQFTVTDLQVFTAMLSEHIRKEERQLFQELQDVVSTAELQQIGLQIREFLDESLSGREDAKPRENSNGQP
jgi:hemerythrin-like domain-containing protein